MASSHCAAAVPPQQLGSENGISRGVSLEVMLLRLAQLGDKTNRVKDNAKKLHPVDSSGVFRALLNRVPDVAPGYFSSGERGVSLHTSRYGFIITVQTGTISIHPFLSLAAVQNTAKKKRPQNSDCGSAANEVVFAVHPSPSHSP